MSAKSNYTQTATLNTLLNTSTVYLALFTTAPNDAYTSESPTGQEVSGNAYARQVIAFSAPAGGTATTPSSTSNSSLIAFLTATPSGWTTIVAFAIMDAPTNGSLLYWDTLSPSQTINAGDILQFQSTAITIAEN